MTEKQVKLWKWKQAFSFPLTQNSLTMNGRPPTGWVFVLMNGRQETMCWSSHNLPLNEIIFITGVKTMTAGTDLCLSQHEEPINFFSGQPQPCGGKALQPSRDRVLHNKSYNVSAKAHGKDEQHERNKFIWHFNENSDLEHLPLICGLPSLFIPALLLKRFLFVCFFPVEKEQLRLCSDIDLFVYELFLISVYSHGCSESDSRARLICRERASVMPHPSCASPRLEDTSTYSLFISH